MADISRVFGENQGYWEYRTFNNNQICYTVRTWNKKYKKKEVRPWTYQYGEWVNKFYAIKQRPIYNEHLLKIYPDKPIMIVEGEKTTDAATRYFPEFLCLTWMGGSQQAKNARLKYLRGKTIYLVPDNDEGGHKAMELLRDKLIKMECKIHLVDVKKLGVDDGWDIANLDDDYGTVDVELALEFIRTSPVYTPKKPVFDPSKYPHLSNNSKPKPLDTSDNLSYLLDFFKITCRWNMMKRKREIIVPETKFYYEEQDNSTLNYITDLTVLHGFPQKRIDKHLDYLASKNTYHPVRDWILSAPSAESGLFEKLCKCIKSTNDPLSYLLLKRWMVSAVAAAFSEGEFIPQGVLVLHGEQYTHKSSFILSLAPKEMKAIKGATTIDPNKKDDIFKAAGYWIIEMAELDATFRKSDISKIKGFITNDEDDERRAFAPKNSNLIRRTVYAATVNEDKFLVDTTGNRRWWTISVTEPINTRHGLNMQHVWQEVYQMWIDGEPPTLTKEEMLLLNEENKEYEWIDPFEEKLINVFDWESPRGRYMNATEILESIGYLNPTRGDCTRIAAILSKKFNLLKGTGRMRYHYMMPSEKSGFKNPDWVAGETLVRPRETYKN